MGTNSDDLEKEFTFGGKKITLKKKLGEGNRGAVFLGEIANKDPNAKKERICVKKETSFKRAAHEAAAIKAVYGMESQVLNKEGTPLTAEDKTQKGPFYFTMPFFPGKTLKSALENGLTLYEKLVIAQKLQTQLEKVYAAGYLHRDIKPDNIMVHIEKGKIEVNIIDLGRSVALNAEDKTLSTPLYSLLVQRQVAPEYLSGKPIGFHSDIYSYGKIFGDLFPENQKTINALTGTEGGKRVSEFVALSTQLEQEFKTRKDILINHCDQLINSLKGPNPSEREIRLATRLRTNLVEASIEKPESMDKVNESFNALYKGYKNSKDTFMSSLAQKIAKFTELFGRTPSQHYDALYKEFKKLNDPNKNSVQPAPPKVEEAQARKITSEYKEQLSQGRKIEEELSVSESRSTKLR